MIIDDVIWEVINNGHCSFKTKTVTNTFCRNVFNLTGLCNRNSCPLANSKYATIIEEKGVCFLYMKTAERAHTPNELWEKIKLDRCYNTALAQIDENLEYWHEFIKHKAKQRFTRIRQMLVKKKKMKLAGSEQYEVVSRKAEKREKSRLVKAEKSALIDRHIEEELIKNVQSGKYKHIWNINQENFEKVLDKVQLNTEQEEEFNSEEIDNVFVGDLYENNLPNDDFGDYDNEAPDNNVQAPDDNGKISKKYKNENDKTIINKKRKRSVKKGGKLNLEYEYEEDKNVEYGYSNDW